jgi:hypothetical protein
MVRYDFNASHFFVCFHSQDCLLLCWCVLVSASVLREVIASSAHRHGFLCFLALRLFFDPLRANEGVRAC